MLCCIISNNQHSKRIEILLNAKGSIGYMWTYTAYMFAEYCKKRFVNQLKFKEFADFCFDNVWRKKHITFVDGKEELYGELKYLERIKLISLDEEKNIDNTIIKISNKKELKTLVEIVENSGRVSGVKLLDEYIKRLSLIHI